MHGVLERRNRTLLDMVRSMLSFSKLLISLWGYALETSYLTNMQLSEGQFMRYLKVTSRYYFYHPEEQFIFITKGPSSSKMNISSEDIMRVK